VGSVRKFRRCCAELKVVWKMKKEQAQAIEWEGKWSELGSSVFVLKTSDQRMIYSRDPMGVCCFVVTEKENEKERDMESQSLKVGVSSLVVSQGEVIPTHT